MKLIQSSRNDALRACSLAAVLVAFALLGGCKSEEAKQQEQVAQQVEATSQQAQKMTDDQLRQKVQEIQQQKGTDPAKMTPEERTLIGQALVKGLL